MAIGVVGALLVVWTVIARRRKRSAVERPTEATTTSSPVSGDRSGDQSSNQSSDEVYAAERFA